MTEYLENFYGEMVRVTEMDNGTAVVTFENGKTFTTKTYEKAINRLYRIGYRF